MKQLLAYAMFAGGVIGVGVFGLPYALVQAGLLPTLVLGLVVVVIVWVSHLAYADVILRTKGKKRLPGYIGTYLGTPSFLMAATINVLGLVGALLAYGIVGGNFVSLFLAPVLQIPSSLATLVYFACGALLLLRGVRQLAVMQLIILALFLVTLVFLGVGTAPHFSWGNLPLLGAREQMAVPYGVLLFAFWGLSLIPELVEMSGRNWAAVRQVLAWSLATAALTFALFAVMIGGVSAQGTSEDALSGIATVLRGGVVLLGAFFGILTTFSSFIALGLTLIRTLVYDFHLRSFLAWVLAMAAPLGLYLLGVQQFIRVLSVTGAIFIGLEGLLVLLMFWVSKPDRSKRLRVLASPVLLATLGVFILIGVGIGVARTLVPP
jgi:tyrosine-specific transport protein